MSERLPERAPLVRIATKALASTQTALEGTTTWLALSDAEGKVVYEWSSTAKLRRHLQKADVTAGADLAEESAGANGIGFALARRAPSIVLGSDHGDERWHNLACAASPVLHPLTRDVLGAVNLTCLANEPNPYLKFALKQVIDEVQDALARASQARHRRLLETHLRVKAGTRAAVITLDRYTMIVDDALGNGAIDRQRLWSLVEEAGQRATELMLPGGEHAQIIPVDPTSLSSGCSLVINRLDPASFVGSQPSAGNRQGPPASLSPLELVEREVIAEILRACNGNKSDAAEKLQISRGTLYERIRRYGL